MKSIYKDEAHLRGLTKAKGPDLKINYLALECLALRDALKRIAVDLEIVLPQITMAREILFKTLGIEPPKR